MLRRLQQQPMLASWLTTAAIAAAVGAIYFLGARLGLLFLTQPEDVAVFWPASGISVGILIACGPRLRLPVAAGVIVATAAANIMGDRALWTGFIFGIANAAEALLTTWLIERWFGQTFRLDTLRRVLAFFLAAGIGAGAAGVLGALALSLMQTSAPLLSTWTVWTISDGLGIVTVAPLLIGLASAISDPPPRREMAEGTAALLALAALTVFVFTLPPQSWMAFEPIAVLFPMLLWVAARYRAVFAAAAVFIVTIALVWTTTFGIGSFGDPSLPASDRILASQAGLLLTALCALVLSAIFAERRRSEAALNSTNKRLQLALEGAELGVWDLDTATGRFQCDARHSRIHSYGQVAPSTFLSATRSYVHPQDLQRVEGAFSAALAGDGVFKVEYRLKPQKPDVRDRVRWIAAEGSVIRDDSGRPLRLLGVTRDITKSKEAESALKESEARLRDALTAGRVTAFEWSPTDGISKRSENAAEIFGSEPRDAVGSRRSDFLRRVHREDRARFKAHVFGVRPDSPAYAVTFRFRKKDGQEVWLEETAKAEFDANGEFRRLKGLTRDVTEQKRAEQHQNLLIAELDHRVKNVLARVVIVARRTRETSASMNEFVNALEGRIQSMANAHGLLSRSRWQGVSLADIVRRELAPYATADNTSVEGPDVTLTAGATQTVAMVLHELATNAAKYGALTGPPGRVSVHWSKAGELGKPSARLKIRWQEMGGPLVSPSPRLGYGTSVIRNLIPHQLDGSVDFALLADGVNCRIEIPLSNTNG